MFINTWRRVFASARWARPVALALVPLMILAACSSDTGDGVPSAAAGGHASRQRPP